MRLIIPHSQNVLLDRYLNAKVADFGYPIPLARQIGSTSILSTSNVSAVVNCRGYLPPEVSEGITGPETDVYGYGIVCIIIIDFPSYIDCILFYLQICLETFTGLYAYLEDREECKLVCMQFHIIY